MKQSRDEQAFADLLEGLRADAPGEMAKLARLAQALEHARPTTGPSPAFRNQLRNRVLAEAALRRSWMDRVMERWSERNASFRRSFRFVFATGVAALVLLTSGAMFAVADTAVPGDWDYGIKRLHENARLLITRGAEQRAYLQMELARERIDEIRILDERGVDDAALYRIAFNDMDARTQDATELIVRLFHDTARKAPLRDLTNFAIAQQNALEVLSDKLPPAVRPSASSSIELLQAVSRRLTGIQAGCLCPANPLLPSASGGGSGDNGGAAETPGTSSGSGCACSHFRSEDTSGAADVGSGTTGPSSGNKDQTPPGPIGPGVGVNPPDVPGTTLDNDVTTVVNDLIDDTLNTADNLLEPLEEITNLPTGLLGGN